VYPGENHHKSTPEKIMYLVAVIGLGSKFWGFVTILGKQIEANQ
jgi:hypothetical protein